MQCQRCHGPTMPETVVKLRRGLLGFRGTRFQGAYCAACGLGALPGADADAAPPPAGIAARPVPGIGWAPLARSA